MKFLINKDEVPNGGFRYRQAETNFLVTAPTWRDLLIRVKQHRVANNLPIGSEFEREVEEQLAGILPDNFVTETNPHRSPVVPRNEWPLWAKMLALVAQPEDKGIGSVIERTIGPFGGSAFKVWYAATFGKSCGCAERRDAFDLQYPLP